MLKKRLQKIACIVLSAAMAVTGAGTGLSGNTVNVSAESKNILDNPSFAANTDGWFATTGDNSAKLEFVNDGKGHDMTGGYVKVIGRSDTWNSLAQTIKDKVKNKTKYNFSCWVKLSDDYTAESTVKVGLTIQSTGDSNGEPVYDGWGISGKYSYCFQG